MAPSRIALAIFILALAAFAVLSPQDPYNSQVVTRAGLTLSLLDGTVSIDRYADRTIDKAEKDGHFYADKVPGHSLLAMPATALARTLINSSDMASEGYPTLVHIATVGTNGLLSALAAAAVFLTAMRLGAGTAGALFGSVAHALATPFLGWSTAFFAHSVTGSLMIIAVAIAVAGLLPGDGWAGRRPTLWAAVLGLLLGFTLVVDLTAAPVIAVGGLVLLWVLLRHASVRPIPTVLALTAGGVVGLAPLPIYNAITFGSPLSLGYSSVVGFEGMQEGLFGVTLPSPAVIYELLFGLYRGLLPLSPILLLVPLGIARMWARMETRVVAGLIAFAALSYLLVNASYHYWNGGWSTGPRHLVPMLPFLGLALCFALPRGRAMRIVAVLLLLVSLVLSAACAVAGMYAPDKYRNALTEWVIPQAMTPDNAWKALAIVLVWIAFGALWLRTVRGRSPSVAPAMPGSPRGANPLA